MRSGLGAGLAQGTDRKWLRSLRRSTGNQVRAGDPVRTPPLPLFEEPPVSDPSTAKLSAETTSRSSAAPSRRVQVAARRVAPLRASEVAQGHDAERCRTRGAGATEVGRAIGRPPRCRAGRSPAAAPHATPAASRPRPRKEPGARRRRVRLTAAYCAGRRRRWTHLRRRGGASATAAVRFRPASPPRSLRRSCRCSCFLHGVVKRRADCQNWPGVGGPSAVAGDADVDGPAIEDSDDSKPLLATRQFSTLSSAGLGPSPRRPCRCWRWPLSRCPGWCCGRRRRRPSSRSQKHCLHPAVVRQVGVPPESGST